jgi:K+-transporting ATPase ATPase B chain
VRKGAADSVRRWVEAAHGEVPGDLAPMVERIAESGGTPLVVADGRRILGVVHLKDTVKEGMTERFRQLREMGIRTVMITGDNPLTARRSPPRPESTTSWPRPRPRRSWR